MKNKMIVLALLTSVMFSQMDKQSVVYDKSYVPETFAKKYSDIRL